MPPKPTPRRRAARAAASPETVGNPLEGTPPSRPRATLSPYPDLSMAIDMLERRKRTVQGERLALVTRWLESLTKLQAEMQKLHKLEMFANRLTSSK